MILWSRDITQRCKWKTLLVIRFDKCINSWMSSLKTQCSGWCVGNSFFVKGQTVDILSFVSHKVSVTPTQFCLCSESSYREYVNKYVWLCSSKTLQNRWIRFGPWAKFTGLCSGLRVGGWWTIEIVVEFYGFSTPVSEDWPWTRRSRDCL